MTISGTRRSAGLFHDLEPPKKISRKDHYAASLALRAFLVVKESIWIVDFGSVVCNKFYGPVLNQSLTEEGKVVSEDRNNYVMYVSLDQTLQIIQVEKDPRKN